MSAMNMNQPSYRLAASTTASSITLSPNDSGLSTCLVTNLGSNAVALMSGYSSATAVFPVAGTPSQCAVIPGGAIITVSKDVNDSVLSAITSSGTADIIIQVGSGE